MLAGRHCLSLTHGAEQVFPPLLLFSMEQKVQFWVPSIRQCFTTAAAPASHSPGSEITSLGSIQHLINELEVIN